MTQDPAHSNRSEGLLPDQDDDRAPEVAEEVSLDLQSDRSRQVGSVPPGKPADALAETLQPPGDPLDEAIERTLPPSV